MPTLEGMLVKLSIPKNNGVLMPRFPISLEYIKNLKVAQRIWIQFRDAEMKAKYPEREAGYYGSIHPMCWSIYLKELTEDRINKLQVWLTGTSEGDSCNGSVKINN